MKIENFKIHIKSNRIGKTRILYLCILLIFNSYAQNYEDVPLSRLSASQWKNFKWDNSGDWNVIDVTKYGVLPNTDDDIAPLIMNIIKNGTGKRILKFPKGTYRIKTTLDILKGNIQFIGSGRNTKFLLSGGLKSSSIVVKGNQTGAYKLRFDVARGASKLVVTSSVDLSVGDFFVIEQKGSLTRPGPGVRGKETQIFKIISKSDNTLTVDFNFGIPFLKDHAKISKINFKENIRFHNFYIEMVSKPTSGKSHNIKLSEVRNVELSNIESNKALHTHMELSWSRDVIFFNNNIYGNFGHNKEGWYQYGIKLNWCTNCHIINNRTADLRHHYATQFGTNHCVIAYNRAEPPYNHYADFGQHNSKGCHNNLWEGNYGCEIYDDDNPKKSWGTRYTVWFRNHAICKIGSESPYVEHMSIIGNEVRGDLSALKTGPTGKDNFLAANVINVSQEGKTGTIIWGALKKDAKLPSSLFLNKKPAYLNKWPLYGPPTNF